MAHDTKVQLPCDGFGACMLCKAKPPPEETLACSTCTTPWHVSCLEIPPPNLASTLQWECPDCFDYGPVAASAAAGSGEISELVAAIRAIEADASLTEREKARKRQELLSGKVEKDPEDRETKNKGKEKVENDVLEVLGGSLNCSFCMQVPERPVTTPCGHNFCLKCFEKWIAQGKRTCAKCRSSIPPKMASQPRINSSLVTAIRMAKLSKANAAAGSLKVYHFIHNQHRPEKAYTTERAQKAGKANAASGKIFVTVPSDHFGPITAENDPERNVGVLVGESWEDRLECRQWGAHNPHVAGIAGQSNYGAQSVALSGGYIDDEDHGEWFLYTGSGGRDLSGNKRTNKEQSFDQKFEKSNEALRVSCKKGYPVRVVRSHKEKRSSYAPEKGVRYDGVYRIEKCWRKVGIQGFKVCRYLFVRCDNEPAPWTSDEHGDRPRPLPVIPELKNAIDITERKESPSWDYDPEDNQWMWKKPPPLSRKPVDTGNPEDRKRSRKAMMKAQNMSVREKLLKEFSCQICRQVMNLPVTTPCAHNFCKSCLEGAFAGKAFVRDRNRGGRALRSQKNVMQCPCCPTDISDFLQNLQVNRELMSVIESLKCDNEEENKDPTEELSEEETDDAEENLDLTIGGTEDGAGTSVETGAHALEDSSSMRQTERPKKHQKVEKESLLDNTDNTRIVDDTNVFAEKPDDLNEDSEKPDDLNEDSETMKHQAEVSGGSNDLQVPVVKRTTKRKNGNAECGSRNPGVEVKTRSSRRIQEAPVDGKDSPSSPLLACSSDDDFE